MGSIGELRGIHPKEATRLRKAGVRTTESLLRHASTKRGRTALARATELEAEKLLDWVNRADLMRIKGVGAEYADLLKMVGVDTVRALRRRNPKSLLAAMVDLNDEKRLVRRLPTEAMVASWVELAAEVDPAVSP
jgi:predicted flap endonuclease-1-like 5' DNA nuclease